MSTLFHDLRFSIRTLRKTPAFAIVAMLTLALGIGATTALFSVVHAVLLRPLPFHQPEQLVRITSDIPGQRAADFGLSIPELFDLRDSSGIFRAVCGLFPISANLTGGDQPERIETLLVDANYFSLLGVKPQLGRLFELADYNPGIAEVSVISDGLWRRRFGADPGVIGKKIRIDDDLYTIIGVTPPGFRHPGRGVQGDVEEWSPAGWVSSPFTNNPPRTNSLLSGALARLQSGLSPAEAQQRLTALAAELQRRYPSDYPKDAGWTLRLILLQTDLSGSVRPSLLILLGAVGLVLLIACANVANLLLARTAARRREFAVRAALGAARGRLIRQMLTESLLLSFLGGALGLLLAVWGTEAIMRLAPMQLVGFANVRLHPLVMLFSLAISFATGVVFGLAPAFQSSRSDLHADLKDAARGTASGARNRLRSLLVVTEFALSLVLLIGAGLLLRTLWEFQRTDPGFRAQNLLTARLWLPQPNIPRNGRYFDHARRRELYRQIFDRLSSLPGVQSVGGASLLPLSGVRARTVMLIEGRAPETTDTNVIQVSNASPGYFSAMEIPLLRGRPFHEHDDETAPLVTLISETAARRYFPDSDPMGRRIRFGRQQFPGPWFTVIGVVGDVKTVALDSDPLPQAYRSLYQVSGLNMAFVLRTAGEPGPLAEAVRREVRAADPELPVFGVLRMEEVLAATLQRQRLAAILLGAFSGFALLLASVGIYGVMSYVTQSRTQEIGIRMALGARPADVLRMVLAQGARLALAGIVIGLAAALLLTQFLRGLLFGVRPTDPWTYLGIALVLGTTAMLACYIPARRATRTDPIVALRYE